MAPGLENGHFSLYLRADVSRRCNRRFRMAYCNSRGVQICADEKNERGVLMGLILHTRSKNVHRITASASLNAAPPSWPTRIFQDARTYPACYAAHSRTLFSSSLAPLLNWEDEEISLPVSYCHLLLLKSYITSYLAVCTYTKSTE